VDTSSLAVWDGVWSNLVRWKVSLPMAAELDLDDLEGVFQPKPLCDAVTL